MAFMQPIGWRKIMDVYALDETPSWEWPGNAGEILRDVISDKNAPVDDRVLAVELSGDAVVLNDELAGLLMQIILDNSEPEELRCHVPFALGFAIEYGDMMGFDDPDEIILSEAVYNEVLECLRSIYYDVDAPKKLRRRALEGVVRNPSSWQKKAIQGAYSSNDDEWVRTAVFCMGYFGGFKDQILEALNNKNPDIFYRAVCSAGNQGVKAAWPKIKEILTDPDVEKPLLLAAISAAAVINPMESVDYLMEFAESDDEEIADTADEAMSMSTLLDDVDDLYDDPKEND